MSEQTAGFGWLPASVQRRMAVEEQAERRAARDAEREREARREAAEDKALNAYKAAAEQRGEIVSALALATGQGIGRSIQDVFADARLAGEREDGRAAARQRHEDGEVCYIDREPTIQGASRSAWPESEYEFDRQLRQAGELHRDLVMTQARLAARQGRSAEHIATQRIAAQRAHNGDVHPSYAPARRNLQVRADPGVRPLRAHQVRVLMTAGQPPEGNYADGNGTPLPDHAAEMMASHQGRPTPAESVAHGVTPAPAQDNGMTEAEKYGSLPSAC
jgi:hypothetical protein